MPGRFFFLNNYGPYLVFWPLEVVGVGQPESLHLVWHPYQVGAVLLQRDHSNINTTAFQSVMYMYGLTQQTNSQLEIINFFISTGVGLSPTNNIECSRRRADTMLQGIAVTPVLIFRSFNEHSINRQLKVPMPKFLQKYLQKICTIYDAMRFSL